MNLFTQLKVGSLFNRRLTSQAPAAVPAPTAKELSTKRKRGVRDIKSGDEPPQFSQGAFSAPMPEPMRATAYCTAESFDWNKLKDQLTLHYKLMPFMADDVFRVQMTNEESSDVFVFSNGTLCAWGATEVELEQLLQNVAPAQNNPYRFFETEYFDYLVDLTQYNLCNLDLAACLLTILSLVTKFHWNKQN